jgi:hypothetical protein
MLGDTGAVERRQNQTKARGGKAEAGERWAQVGGNVYVLHCGIDWIDPLCLMGWLSTKIPADPIAASG